MREQSSKPSEAIVLQPGAGERLTVVGEVVRILADAKATNGACTIMELTVPAGDGPPLHRHHLDDEHFYIVEGTILFEMNGKRVVLGPGGFLRAPRGSRHAFRNVGAGPGRIIVVCTPGGIDGPFREVDALSRDREPTPEELTAVFAKFDLDILGPPIQA
jgi:mannose-6-phosphate isomerase-like protein (cupin superfamily)